MNKKNLGLIVLSLSTALSNTNCREPRNANVELKDFNRDGKKDYAINIDKTGEEIVFISNPDGTYTKGYRTKTDVIELIEYIGK